MLSVWISVAFSLLLIGVIIVMVRYKEDLREFMSNAESNSVEDGDDGSDITGNRYIQLNDDECL